MLITGTCVVSDEQKINVGSLRLDPYLLQKTKKAKCYLETKG
jgi:hypothetical protein